VLPKPPTESSRPANWQSTSLITLTVSYTRTVFLRLGMLRPGLAIVTAIKAAPNVAVALIIEPDSLPNLVTNANLTTCSSSASDYQNGVAYALKNLNLPNVAMYIDAGHGGWLGWDANLRS